MVGAEDGYYIDTNINYTYFMKGEEKIGIQSGAMKLNANTETQKYEISMEFILEDGSKVNATYEGEISGKGFAIFDELQIQVNSIEELIRTLPTNGAVDGQCYLKVAFNNWDIEMRLICVQLRGRRFFPPELITSVTMVLSERWTANSVISQSIRMVSLPVNLNQVRWKSPNPVKYIPLR